MYPAPGTRYCTVSVCVVYTVQYMVPRARRINNLFKKKERNRRSAIVYHLALIYIVLPELTWFSPSGWGILHSECTKLSDTYWQVCALRRTSPSGAFLRESLPESIIVESHEFSFCLFFFFFFFFFPQKSLLLPLSFLFWHVMLSAPTNPPPPPTQPLSCHRRCGVDYAPSVIHAGLVSSLPRPAPR